MIEFISQNWWIAVLIIGYIISRFVKKDEKNKKTGAETALDEIVKNIIATQGAEKSSEILEKTLGGKEIIKNPVAKKAVGYAVDKVIEDIVQEDDKNIPDTIDGKSHPLYKFANKAIEKEKTTNKVLTGVKKTGVFVLKIGKHLL